MLIYKYIYFVSAVFSNIIFYSHIENYHLINQKGSAYVIYEIIKNFLLR